MEPKKICIFGVGTWKYWLLLCKVRNITSTSVLINVQRKIIYKERKKKILSQKTQVTDNNEIITKELS